MLLLVLYTWQCEKTYQARTRKLTKQTGSKLVAKLKAVPMTMTILPVELLLQQSTMLKHSNCNTIMYKYACPNIPFYLQKN